MKNHSNFRSSENGPVRSARNLGHRTSQRAHALPGAHLAEVSAGKSNRAMKREEHRAHARRMEFGTADRVFMTRPGHSELANGRLYHTVEVGKTPIRLTPDSCLAETETRKVLAPARACRKYSMPSAESLAYAASVALDALEQPTSGLERPDPIVTAISNRAVRVAQPELSVVHGCYAIRLPALCHTCLVLQYRYLGRNPVEIQAANALPVLSTVDRQTIALTATSPVTLPAMPAWAYVWKPGDPVTAIHGPNTGDNM